MYITTKEHTEKSYNVTFIEFEYDGNPITESSLKTFNKTGIIDNEFSADKVHKEFIKIISDMNIHEITPSSLNESTLNNASTYLATNGRIGQATNLIVSQNVYRDNEILLKNFKNKKNIEIVFDNSIQNNIYLYRKNEIDQPGIILLKYENFYKLESIGLQPEKQFIKIVT